MIVVLDGPSGAGKSTIAERTARAWQEAGVPVSLVRMDDIYPGWRGLRAASDHVETFLIEPFAAGRPGRWREWDWSEEGPGAWHTVPDGHLLLLEGCGSLTGRTAPCADLSVWLDADDTIRHRRAIERDGDLFARWWDVWQEQFDDFVEREHPRGLADLILDGTAPGADRLVIPLPRLR